jgi:hypothetical protein
MLFTTTKNSPALARVSQQPSKKRPLVPLLFLSPVHRHPSITRRVFLKDFPYAVVYRPASDGIIVFALAHRSRRPGYWLLRVQDR